MYRAGWSYIILLKKMQVIFIHHPIRFELE
jgi:hypothetical protein